MSDIYSSNFSQAIEKLSLPTRQSPWRLHLKTAKKLISWLFKNKYSINNNLCFQNVLSGITKMRKNETKYLLGVAKVIPYDTTSAFMRKG